MASVYVKQAAPPSPPPEVATVTVHALSAGYLTLPEGNFVHPACATARHTVPSLAFLVQHKNPATEKLTRIVFDLGLRRDINRYAEPIKKHASTRQPLSTDPDVVKSLAKGGLTPDDVDYVFYSHVHWDHVGEPLDFPSSTFVVGRGALELLSGTSTSLRGGHSFFEPDLLPADRTLELPELSTTTSTSTQQRNPPAKVKSETLDFTRSWQPYLNLPHTLDIFADSSVLIVSAPGHLPGHINLLIRTSPSDSVYLAGDACHDRRIMRGEREIGEWKDAEGHVCCIHADRKEAERTIERIRELERGGVEVVFAHDVEWEGRAENRGRFWGASDD